MWSSSSVTSSTVSSENLPPRALARVSREVRDMMKKVPEGTKLIVDTETGLPQNLGEIMAELEGPEGTPYASRFYRLKLILPSDYPNSPPRGFFLTKIYHPNVDMSTGAICVNTLKKDWTPSVTMSHVLSVIRCLLIVPFPESSLNDEAGKLFMESYDEYARRAKLMANVHGRQQSFSENVLSPTGSPVKNSKENENRMEIQKNQNLKSTSFSSSGAILKQSNSVDRHTNDGKKSITKSASGKSVDKKSKKKSLKRL